MPSSTHQRSLQGLIVVPDRVEMYTDGACRGNPGPGGWGVVLRFRDKEKELYGSEVSTTNNRMELIAVISGLHSLTKSCHVRITTDSKYVLQGVTTWMPQWKKRAWKTADRKDVKNRDLWEKLDAALQGHTVEWEWVRGHQGHEENERADRLANRGIDELLKG